jgi:hypothetical protein
LLCGEQHYQFVRLTAGGDRIRTIGPALVKGLSAVADERRRTDKLDGVIKHRSSRETTMVGRGASPTAASRLAWNEECLLLFIRWALLGDAFECPFLEGLLNE